MRELIKSRYFKWGLTLCLSLVGAIVIFLILDKFSTVHGALGTLMNILAPFIYGAVMAYLLRPVYNGCYLRTDKLLKYFKIKSERAVDVISRIVSVALSMTLLFVAIFGLVMSVIPQFVSSLYDIVVSMPGTAVKFMDWIQGIDFVDENVKRLITDSIDNMIGNVDDWIKFTVIPYLKEVALKVSAGIVGAASFVFDIFVGFVVCIYILLSKSTFSAQAKKISFSVFEKDTANTIINGARYVDKVFNGFISGNIIDALIVGAITFVVMSLFNFPFELLISVLVAVTNLIPFFGPFIGGAVGAVLLLTVNPMDALYFIIFVLILQQLDGNVIKPKILSDAVDLSSFWILFSIVVGGGLFGFAGMILGVPVFTVIYAFISWAIDKRLSKKNLPEETESYADVDYYDFDKGEFVFLPENLVEERKEEKRQERRKRKEERRNRWKR